MEGQEEVPRQVNFWWRWGALGCAGLILMSSVVFFIIGLGSYVQMLRESPQYGGGGGGFAGCSIPDNLLTDPASELTNADVVLQKLGRRYHPEKAKIQEILDKSRTAKVNPAIIIAIWGKEQSFGNPNEAFGIRRASGWSNELKEVIEFWQEYIREGQVGKSVRTFRKRQSDRTLFNFAMTDYTPPSDNGYSEGTDYSKTKDYRTMIGFLQILVSEQLDCQAETAIVKIARLELAKHPVEWDNNVLKYTNGRRDNWCAYFVSWVFQQAGHVLRESSAMSIKDYFEKNGQLITDFAAGQPGDVIIWSKGGGHGHVGIVTDNENGVIYTIEGNTGGGDVDDGRYTQRNKSSTSNGVFVGYGRLKK